MKKLTDLKIIFFGTSVFSEKILSELLKQVPIALVVTQPDRPAGRKKELLAPPVKDLALRENLPLKQFSKIDQPALDFIRQIEPDLIVVASYGLILPQALLEIPAFGCVNVHPSLLPKYRGATPIQGALLNGDQETGVTLMIMNEKMDAGDILIQEKVPVEKDETYPALQDKLIAVAARMIGPTLENLINGKIQPRKQADEEATYVKMIKKQDGLIDWHRSADEIYNQYRAYSYWPQIYSFWEGKRIILEKIALPELKNAQAKRLIAAGKIAKQDEKVLVGTGTQPIELVTVKLEGKKSLPIQEFIKGYPDFIDSQLKTK